MNFGIIADGNRRWAKENGKSIADGHYQGFLTLKDIILPAIRDDGRFKAVTIYGFSTENWRRSPLEVLNLMKIFSKIFTEFSDELVENKTRLIHAGRKDRLPKKLLSKIENLEERTKDFTGYTIYMCLDYGGQDEILRAFSAVPPLFGEACLADRQSRKGNAGNLETFEKHLEVPPLDCILRTGGENRLSNFCLWQAAYAELFFVDKKLPELTKNEVLDILKKFEGRDRRKGK